MEAVYRRRDLRVVALEPGDGSLVDVAAMEGSLTPPAAPERDQDAPTAAPKVEHVVELGHCAAGAVEDLLYGRDVVDPGGKVPVELRCPDACPERDRRNGLCDAVPTPVVAYHQRVHGGQRGLSRAFDGRREVRRRPLQLFGWGAHRRRDYPAVGRPDVPRAAVGCRR